MAGGKLLERALTGAVTAAAVATVGVVVRDGHRRRIHPPRVLSWDEVMAQLEITPEPWQRWWLETFLDGGRVRAGAVRRWLA